jgi:hypothetical protein
MRIATAVGIVASLALSASASERGFFDPKTLTAEEQAVVDKAPLGSKENPIRCEAPEGERAYLKRLRCPSGKAPKFERSGSVGLGPYEMIMDLYEVRCSEWSEPADVYMDMYHEGYKEKRADPKFTITD